MTSIAVGTGYSRASASAAASSTPPPRRPASIQELAQRAEIQWDSSKDFKFWLKVAEKARHAGQDYDLHGDLENAFVEYARAATLILDKIPTHKDYHTRLDQMQRDTLIMKGKGVLDRMGMLKPPIIDRHNAWENAQLRGGSATPRTQPPPSSYDPDRRQRDQTPSRKPSMNGHQRDEREPRQIWYPDTAQERRRRDEQQHSPRAQSSKPRAQPAQRTRVEQEGILQRQREADEQARAIRNAARLGATSNNIAPGFVSIPVPSAPPITPQRSMGQSSNRSGTDSSSALDTPPLLPLESPHRRYDTDDTDLDTEEGSDELYKKVAELTMAPKSGSGSGFTTPFGGPAPPPITTTSHPPPTISPVSYPQLMTQHQRTQGYAPSLQSMFIQPSSSLPQSTLLFDSAPPPPKHLYQNILPPQSQPTYANEREREHSHQRERAYMYGPREPPPHSQSHSPARHGAGTSPRPPVPQRPAYEMPQPYQQPPSLPNPSPRVPTAASAPPRIAPASSPDRPDRDPRELRQVNFPRAVLPRFLAIAAVNTAKNRETCGLLLGKPRGHGAKYVVTTLLIPKQNSTSDTCNMDEEELVLEFTEARGLITLGWIHTHPTQSCFMSSVDLHTHSGFQRMLPESFAVVCAPQHTPNFGIFRLTDPPGLKTILECEQKSAFHPHPDLPIYTDADKGHVQMKDMPLEIVDLR